jgi:hypothetical protein
MDLAVLAGVLSTGLFVMSYLPMLVKAARTRDLSSYSIGNLAITNVGNAVHSVYVFSLPLGPIWFLHTFYLVASALMLFWFLKYRSRRPASSRARPSPPAALVLPPVSPGRTVSDIRRAAGVLPERVARSPRKASWLPLRFSNAGSMHSPSSGGAMRSTP